VADNTFPRYEDYDPSAYIWPDNIRPAPVRPVRVGMDRKTGKMLVGWSHTEQSIFTIFVTRYHDRVLRRWVGSFVPHILGELATSRVITRFYWAIASAIDLWEPNYRVTRVRMLTRSPEETAPNVINSLTSPEELRLGHATFRNEGIHRPRAHLGDVTPETQKSMGIVGNGQGMWDRPQP